MHQHNNARRFLRKQFCLFFLFICICSCAEKEVSEKQDFKTRGIILDVNDLSSGHWPKRAKEAGINTIAAHVTPSQVAAFILSDRGKQFLNECKEYGIEIEYELHAMADLLPRELFEKDSTMFRINEEGRRVADYNLCVHSEKALDTVCKNAIEYARLLTPTTGRYFYWIDDGAPMCFCPDCKEYSDSEQALLLENRIIKALKKVDKNASLSHLAYHNTIKAPSKVKPEEGIFLEFAPFHRTWERPINDLSAIRKGGQITHGKYLEYLAENLKVFPIETAQILEYWLDVSLFSNWEKPARELPWNKEVFLSDIDTYAKFGIKHITSFGVYLDSAYFNRYKDHSFLKEYGQGFVSIFGCTPREREDSLVIIPLQKNTEIAIDGSIGDKEWTRGMKITKFLSPWGKGEIPETIFYALSDSLFFYFAFKVADENNIVKRSNDEKDVASGDRVEVFFTGDKALKEYYCLEIGPYGDILDYKASFYRSFDNNWDLPCLSVKTSVSKKGYEIEGRFPLSLFDNMEELHANRGKRCFYMGVYRADFIQNRQENDSILWLTWIDPVQKKPDFHLFSSFSKVCIASIACDTIF